MTMLSNKIIVSLDTNVQKAFDIVLQLENKIKILKIGPVLSSNTEMRIIIPELQCMGFSIFDDRKLYDIPSIVHQTVENLSKTDIFMTTIHLSGGTKMVNAACIKKDRLKIIGVMELTSSNIIDNSALEKYKDIINNTNIDGLIVPPNKIGIIKNFLKKDLIIISPGIRPTWYENQDQKQFTTPLKALKNGADYIIIGRPIIDPPSYIGSSKNALELIMEELERGER